MKVSLKRAVLRVECLAGTVVWICAQNFSACGNDRLAVQDCCCSGSGKSSTNRMLNNCRQLRPHVRTLFGSIKFLWLASITEALDLRTLSLRLECIRMYWICKPPQQKAICQRQRFSMRSSMRNKRVPINPYRSIRNFRNCGESSSMRTAG